MRLIFFIVLILFTAASKAQTSKKKGQSQNTPSSVDPNYQKETYEPRKSKKTSKGPTFELEQEYYERMAKLEKTRKKNEKLMMSPQYSDPMYFGHKRPPKKRKPGKMKYCRECGIRH